MTGRDPLTVVYYNECTGLGGTERYLLSLACSLDPGRFSPIVIVPELGREESAPFAERFARHGVPVRVVDYPDGSPVPVRIRWARRLFGSLREELGAGLIAHFNVYTPGAYGAEILGARLAGVRRIVLTDHLPTLGWEGLNAAGRAVAAAAGRAASVTVTHSEAGRRHVDARPLHGHRTVVVSHGVDVSSFFRPAARSAARAELELAEHEVVLLAIGRLVPQKAHAVLLEAIALLAQESTTRTRLLVAGEGPLRDELTGRAAGLGLADRVALLGHREDVAELLAACDLYVLPSRFEGMPFSVLEAMAAGKPVVATDVDGVGEAVVDGTSGLLVPPGDPERLAAALARLLRDPAERDRLGAGGRELAAARFSISAMVEATEAVYERLGPASNR